MEKILWEIEDVGVNVENTNGENVVGD